MASTFAIFSILSYSLDNKINWSSLFFITSELFNKLNIIINNIYNINYDRFILHDKYINNKYLYIII